MSPNLSHGRSRRGYLREHPTWGFQKHHQPHLLHPRAIPESKAKISDGILEALRNGKHTRYLKASDTATGEMVACAKWKVFDRERSPQELEKELELPEPLPESDVRTWNAFFTDLSGARREMMGTRPYFCSHYLLLWHLT